MPNTADRDGTFLPRLSGVDADDVPPSVLQDVIRRLQAAEQAGPPVSLFENYVGGARDGLSQAA